MKDFGARMFNPQPEPPANPNDLATAHAAPTPYKWVLSDVMVTSYNVGGSGQSK